MAKLNDLEELKKEFLPKTVNLHSMVTKSVNYTSDPIFIEDSDGTKIMIKDDKTLEFELSDHINQMEITIKVTKTVFPEPVQ